MSNSHQVVVVGAGFAGLTCARELAKNPGVHVTVIDRNPYQTFSPLLYQVATGGLPEDDIAYPVRAAIPGVDFRRGEVVRIDPLAKNIRLDDASVIQWDELVLATGSVGTTYGVPGVAENALQMKNIQEAKDIRRRLLITYEDVDVGKKPKEALRVVVVGGGPTGVEVTGAVAELQRSMKHEFPALRSSGTSPWWRVGRGYCRPSRRSPAPTPNPNWRNSAPRCSSMLRWTACMNQMST